jgi:DNA-binding NarL/FixJ family response regulator
MQSGRHGSVLAGPAKAGSLTVSVAADEDLLRRRIAATLSTDGLSVEFRNGQPCTRVPDVVVLALDLSQVDRVLTLRNAIEVLGPAPTVIVSPRAGGPAARRALRAGARALVFEDEIDTAIAPVVRAVAADQTCVPRRMKLAVNKPALSYREREVLTLAISGRTNSEIAATLYLAESTVKCHLSSAFRSLGVRSRREAASLVLDPAEGLGTLVVGSGSLAPVAAVAGASSDGA